jgi:hypothetical protein
MIINMDSMGKPLAFIIGQRPVKKSTTEDEDTRNWEKTRLFLKVYVELQETTQRRNLQTERRNPCSIGISMERCRNFCKKFPGGRRFLRPNT